MVIIHEFDRSHPRLSPDRRRPLITEYEQEYGENWFDIQDEIDNRMSKILKTYGGIHKMPPIASRYFFELEENWEFLTFLCDCRQSWDDVEQKWIDLRYEQ